MTRAMRFGLIGWLAWTLASPLVAQPFTYQGFLKDSGNPANGIYDFRFSLWTAPSGGTRVGEVLFVNNVSVQNGLFTVQLDFGAVWDGSDRYLEISVRLAGAPGYRLLTPRVKITPAPYASFSMRPWQTSGSNIFYNDGNVGIGTDIPFARLSLGEGNANTKLAIWQGYTSADVMGLGVGPAQFRLHLHNATNRFSFLNAPAGTEIVTILGNGNVGIGTSSPSQKLHVEGNGYFSGNVGIGTSNPSEKLHVVGNGYFSGYVGIGTIPTNPLHVVSRSPHSAYFENDSYGCWVVYGYATHQYGGVSYGVMGSSRSTAGRGVGGWATADEGETFGVIGVSFSPSGSGVCGQATSSWGASNGVFGENFSTSGRGVAGLARAYEGYTSGVWGESWSPSGRGVYGLATSHEGTTFGVLGESRSSSGRGVYGLATTHQGTTFGVYGESRSRDGRAVYGLASATTGWNFGVAGESRSPDGLGGWFGSAGKKGARVVGQGGRFYEDWAADWHGGLETWDIVCASIRYNALLARSDERLKRDIHPLDASSELQRLLSLRPVSYYWRDESLPQTLQYGLIAQELQQVFPELVSEAEDEQKTLAVNYQALIPLLVNALQVQQEQIRQQEARIQKLEAELQRLQATTPK